MAKQSAGILLYRKLNGIYGVLLGHPGGPFFAKKDDGVWSIPKGEFGEDEDPLQAAKREFTEEIGTELSMKEFMPLGTVKQTGGKTIHAWAVESDIDVANIKSNVFSMEWPPKSGRQQDFPEIDRANWFSLSEAKKKLFNAQIIFIDRLTEQLYIDISEVETQSTDNPQP